MTIALRGYTQGAYSATGQHTVAWPSGTASGDLAIWLVAPGSDKKPTTKMPAGWILKGTKSDGTSLYAKTLTTADIATPLVLTGRIELGVVLSGAQEIESVGASDTVQIGYVNGAALLFGWRSTTDDLTAGKIHASDIVNSAYLYKNVARRYNAWLSVPDNVIPPVYFATNASAFFSLSIRPLTAVPPLLVSPPNGALVDVAPGVPFAWKIVGGASVYPKSILDIRAVGDTTWIALRTFYNGVESYTGGYSPTPDTSWEWRVRSLLEVGGAPGAASEVWTFTQKAKPTLTCSVSGSGFARTITWTPTITNGVQVSFRARVAAAADGTPDNPIWDSGTIAGTDTSIALPLDIPWTNGASYKAWVEFEQTGGQVTVPTASSSFTVSWTVPDGPATPTVQPGAPTTVSAAGLTVGRKVRLSYTVGGVSREAVKEVTAASMSFDVPLAPYGIPTTYSIEQSGTVSGVEVWSDPVTVTGISYDARSYVVSTDGLSWRRVVIYRASEPEDTEGISVSYGLGSSTPSVLRTPSQGLRGEDVVIVETQAAKDDLLEWLADNPTFDFRRPPERSRTTLVDVPPLRVARVSQRSESRLVNSQVQLRTIPLSWVQQ